MVKNLTLSGLYVLAGIVHRDLKPSNTAVEYEQFGVKILDFGLARKFTPKDGSMTGYVVMRWYRAPELITFKAGSYDKAVDMWSIGCILAELLTQVGDRSNGHQWRVLFPGKDELSQIKMIASIIGQ